MLTVAQVAERLHVDEMTVRRAIWAGELAWVNIGRPGKRARIRVRESALEAYLSAREMTGRIA